MSDINENIPQFGNATTAGVRANFEAAKNEIEELQQQIGYADYNDSATASSPIAVSPSTWTKLTNDTLGSNTRISLPVGVDRVWNPVTDRLDLTDLPIDTMVEYRADLIVTTSGSNQVVKFDTRLAIGHASEFTLESTEFNFKSSSAKRFVVNGGFYIGSAAVRDNAGEFRLWSDSSCTVVVNGWYIRVIKNIGV